MRLIGYFGSSTEGFEILLRSPSPITNNNNNNSRNSSTPEMVPSPPTTDIVMEDQAIPNPNDNNINNINSTSTPVLDNLIANIKGRKESEYAHQTEGIHAERSEALIKDSALKGLFNLLSNLPSMKNANNNNNNSNIHNNNNNNNNNNSSPAESPPFKQYSW